jgi:hypothetical protein
MTRPRRVLLAVVLPVFLAALPAGAGIGRWTPYGPPSGSLLDLTVHPSGRLLVAAVAANIYAKNVEGGVYASDDGGRSWLWSGTGMGAEKALAMAVDPEDGDLYAVGVTRFFRSTDQGRTWTVRAQSLPLGEPALGEGSDLLTLVPGSPTRSSWRAARPSCAARTAASPGRA